MALLEATIKLLTEDAVSSKHGQGCWLWLHLHLQACPDQCLFSKSFVFTLLIGMRASPPLPTLAVGTPLAPYNVDPTIRQLNSWPLVFPPEIQQDNTEQQKPQCPWVARSQCWHLFTSALLHSLEPSHTSSAHTQRDRNQTPLLDIKEPPHRWWLEAWGLDAFGIRMIGV